MTRWWTEEDEAEAAPIGITKDWDGRPHLEGSYMAAAGFGYRQLDDRDLVRYRWTEAQRFASRRILGAHRLAALEAGETVDHGGWRYVLRNVIDGTVVHQPSLFEAVS